MGWLSELATAIKQTHLTISGLLAPEQIAVEYPAGSPSEGVVAGRFLKCYDENGAKYEWQQHPVPDSFPVHAELVINHEFEDLASLFEYMGDGDRDIFVHAVDGEPMQVVAMSDFNPEDGSLSLSLRRHPSYLRWFSALKGGQVDLTHIQLADLLIDNQEDLANKDLASYVAQFRAAKRVDYTADLDAAGSFGVMVTWQGGTVSDPKSTPAKIPREFEARIPAYVGAWEPGAERHHMARFRLRVVPKRQQDGEVAPTFRLIWTNYAEYELEAAQAVRTAIEEMFEGNSASVYLGVPHAERFFIPKKTQQISE